MAQTKNKSIKSSDKKNAFTQDVPNVSSGFSCSWATFWKAIGVLIAFLVAILPLLNWLANIKIKPVYREIKDCKDRIEQTNTLISINEKRRDESIGYQIKIIEQKIELSRIEK